MGDNRLLYRNSTYSVWQTNLAPRSSAGGPGLGATQRLTEVPSAVWGASWWWGR